MALSEIDIKDTLYQFLRGSELVQAVSGGVYKDSRPSNSKVEDILIAIVTSDTEQVQEFTVNVNVFVPDIPRQNDMIENDPRLRELAALCLSLFKTAAFGGFNMKLRKQRIMAKEGEIPFHVINNSLSVKVCPK